MSKVHCTNCTYFKENKCIKDSKNGYNNCKKFKAIPIADLKKERNALLLSKENPERLAYITERLIEFNGGTL